MPKEWHTNLIWCNEGYIMTLSIAYMLPRCEKRSNLGKQCCKIKYHNDDHKYHQLWRRLLSKWR